MTKVDVQSLKLGPKPKAWATSVFGNLDRLAKDQSISPEVRENIRLIRGLLIELFSKRYESEKWSIQIHNPAFQLEDFERNL